MKEKETDAEKDSKKKKRWKEVMTRVTDLDKQIQKLAKEFALTSARAEELSKEVAATSQKIEAFGRDLATNQELAATLPKTIESSNAKIEALMIEIAEYKQGMEKEFKNLDSRNDLGALKKEITTSNEKVESLQKQLSGITGSIEQLDGNSRETHESLEKQENAISVAVARADSFETKMLPKITERLDGVDKNIAAFNERLQGMAESFASMSPRIESGQGDVPVEPKNATLEDEIRKLSDRLGVLENHTSGYGEKIGALQTAIASVTKRLADIENETAASMANSFDEL